MIELLNKEQHYKALPFLEKVAINHLFAKAVLEGKVVGSVYADSTETPETFYILHPYGMSLLFGKLNPDLLNLAFSRRGRKKQEWLQVFPDSWNSQISKLLSNRLVNPGGAIENPYNIEVHTRVNFRFNKQKYLAAKSQFGCTNQVIYRTDKDIFDNLKGEVIPGFFWKNADHFCHSGVGYSLIYDRKAVSTAFSAFINESQLELGIETIKEFRGKGFAECVCAALIDYCIENHLEPVWACRLENHSSYLLAQKLGFEPTIQIPYYKLI